MSLLPRLCHPSAMQSTAEPEFHSKRSRPPSPSKWALSDDEDAPLLISDISTSALAMSAWKSLQWSQSPALLLYRFLRCRCLSPKGKVDYTEDTEDTESAFWPSSSQTLASCAIALVVGATLLFLTPPHEPPPSTFLPTLSPLSAAAPPLSPSSDSHSPSPSKCDVACPWFRAFDSPILSRTQSLTGADWSSYVTPTNFRDLSDWVYWRHAEVIGANDPLVGVNASTAIECLSVGALIYVQSTMLGKFWDEVHPLIRHPYFLVTGSADGQVPGGWEHFLDPSPDGRPSQLMHWFGQNGNSTHPHFTSIPIGIPFPMTDALDLTLHGQQSLVEGDWYDQDKVTVDGGELGVADRHYHRQIVDFHWDHSGDWDEDRWVLVNFDLHTNERERLPVWRMMCGNESEEVTALPYVRCVLKERGTRQYYGGMRATYHRYSRYRFHLSPPGNGMDCHRTWEAIYLGVVPVLISSPLNRLFTSLPVMIVNQWEEVTMASLKSKWEELVSVHRGKSLAQMHFSYWKNVVIGVAKRELAERNLTLEPSWTDFTVQRRKCWGHVDR